ncbi:MAG: hypothetical protein K2X11_23030 [Acetobacteraceae bacterium]|nr:hypothetical protein [Acetobacteraceae bacterium]
MRRIGILMVAALLSAPACAQVARDLPDPVPSDPVPRDLPGPSAPPGPTPPERIEGRDPRPGQTIPQDGVIRPREVPPMPQADVPVERPGTTPVIPPPGTPSGPPGPQPR